MPAVITPAYYDIAGNADFLPAIQPIITRVRTDITAVKSNGKSFWRRDEPLTKANVLVHLNGGLARGVCPIKEGESTTMLALLDCDSHKGETPWHEMVQVARIVVDELERRGMKPTSFRSSGGKGIHLFILWDTPQDAYSVREFLGRVLGAVGYRNGTAGVAKGEIEIFPKQDSVPLGGCGNQFILPLTGLSAPLEPLADFKPMEREYALSLEWPSSPDVPVVKPAAPLSRAPIQYGLAIGKLQQMLNHIDPDSGYDTWLKVGMALHYETDGSDDGLALWDEWSLQGSTYEDGVTQQKWDSFKTDKARSVTAKSIQHLARMRGWKENTLEELDALPTTEPPLLDPKDQSGIAQQLLKANFYTADGVSLLRAAGLWYEYRGVCYQERADEGIRAAVRKYLDHALKLHKDSVPVPFHPTVAQINGVLDALRSTALVEHITPPVWLRGHKDADPREFVSLTNGLLHIPTRSLIPHTADFFTVNALPYAWETHGEPVEWLRFLGDVWPEDEESQNTLQEMFGYLLTPDVSQHKMFLIKGPKRSGKGTIGRVIKELVGQANACGPSLTSLASAFGLQPLIGKLVAIVPDARVGGRIDKQGIVERLLMVSGEDNITIDRKHIDAWTGTLAARFIMFTNEVPQLGDASGALSSRFITVAMQHSFYGKEDHGLQERLLKELPQIFRWALDGKDRLKARGYFIQPASAVDVVESLEKLNSPISAFVSEMCELRPEYEISKDSIYGSWKLWCMEAGREHPGTKDRFCESLLDAFPAIKKSRPRCAEKRYQVFQGIRVRNCAMDTT